MKKVVFINKKMVLKFIHHESLAPHHTNLAPPLPKSLMKIGRFVIRFSMYSENMR